MADRVGQQLGNYRLVHLLGRGGFADVYLGKHIYLETSAAIKVLHTQLATDEVERFRTEARTVARLTHPHIVRVLEYGIDDVTPFLVIDYAPNGTLRKRHAKGTPLPLTTVVDYVTQLADALQYAHDQKVIHRDVKPENILMGQHNEVLLSDFGIALVAQGSHYHSTQSMQDVAGTVAYMAPEQIQSQACLASDQYSLGIVVYEWLSGMRPFEGSFTEIAVKQTMVLPPSLCTQIPTLSPAIEAVVMKALAKDPKQRFDSVKAFASALEQVYLRELSPPVILNDTSALAERPVRGPETIVLSRPSTRTSTPLTSEIELPVQPLRHGVSSRRRILQWLAGAAVVSAIGTGIAWLIRVQPSPIGPRPVERGTPLYTYQGHTDVVWSVAWSPSLGDNLRVASASGDKTVQVWSVGPTATNGTLLYTHDYSDSVYGVAWSPDGRRIASGNYDKTVQVWNATNSDDSHTYQGHTGVVWSVAWSPDGTQVASASVDKTARIWDLAHPHPRFIYRGHSNSVFAVAWSPDGRHIASAGSDGTVHVWNATNGAHISTYPAVTGSIWAVAWSPDGTRIASAGDDKVVHIWDATNSAHLYAYAEHTGVVYAVVWSPDGQRIASASGDTTVQVWNATNSDHPYIYQGHTASVRTVAWAPGGKYIASGSWDKTVQIWQPE